jgi:MoxR-like ATPase
MTEPTPRRRHRFPQEGANMALLVLLSAIAAAIAVVATVVAVSLWIRLNAQTHRLNHVVEQIQVERRRNTLHGCLDQNSRHDRTIQRLDKIIARLDTPEQRARAARGRASTVLLIDALAPHRDCDHVLATQVRGTRP